MQTRALTYTRITFDLFKRNPERKKTSTSQKKEKNAFFLSTIRSRSRPAVLSSLIALCRLLLFSFLGKGRRVTRPSSVSDKTIATNRVGITTIITPMRCYYYYFCYCHRRYYFRRPICDVVAVVFRTFSPLLPSGEWNATR